MTGPSLRQIPIAGAHRPHGTTWALARGLGHALAPDPASPGPVRGLEREAAFHLAAAHAVAFGEPDVAFQALLAALPAAPGGELVLPALCAPWVPAAVTAAGWTAVWADIDPDTLHLSPAALRRALGPRAAAVLVRHTAGVPCDLDALAAAAGEVPLIEDFGPAIGARWHARPVGGLGHAGIAAFDAARSASVFGGTLVCTGDDALCARLREAVAALPEASPVEVAVRLAAGNLRALRARPALAPVVRGPRGTEAALRGLLGRGPAPRARMHPSQAEAARSGFFALAGHLDGVRERAATLRHGLPAGAWRQAVPDGALPAWSRLLVRSRDPEGCAAAAARAGVRILPRPLRDASEGACPEAARAAAACVALPCHPALGERDLARVLGAIEGWTA